MRRSTGFTLAEVLVVAAIVAILAAIAYPSYAGYITRTRRIEGQIALLELVQQQERYYTRHNSYLAFSPASSDAQERQFKWWSGNTPASSAYELRGQACPGQVIGQCIELQATPGTARVDARFKDTECGTMTLNSAGQHSASGSHPNCWP